MHASGLFNCLSECVLITLLETITENRKIHLYDDKYNKTGRLLSLYNILTALQLNLENKKESV